MADSNTKICW